MQPFWNHQISTLMPARLIEDQKQMFLRPDFLFVSERSECERKGRGIDCWHEQPTGLAALGLHKPIEIHPLIARSDDRSHSGSLARPDAAEDGFESDAVFVLTPEFNARLGIRLTELLDFFWEFFEKPAG